MRRLAARAEELAVRRGHGAPDGSGVPWPAATLAERTPWLAGALQPLWPAYRQVLTVSFFTNILALAAPIYTMQVYDRVVYHHGFSTLQGLTFGMILALAFDYILRQGRARLLQGCGARLELELGRPLFEKIGRLPLARLESRPPSYWQSLFHDAQVVRMTWSGPTAMVLVDLPFLFLGFVAIAAIALPLAWVMAVAALLFLGLAVVSGRDFQASGKQGKSLSIQRDAAVGEFSAARDIVKAQALQETFRRRWLDKQLAWQEHSQDRTERMDRYRDMAQILVAATTVFMTVVGALAILDQEMTMGALIAANMLSGRVLGPLNQLVTQWKALSDYRQSRDRLHEIFSAPSDVAATALSLPRPRGELHAENLSFAYAEGGPRVLSEVKVKFGPGGLYCVTGPNGSGKTTFLKVLRGLYTPTGGRVLLDGGDLAQFSQKDLARWIGYLPQSVRLFAGTIRDNIALRNPEASDEDIHRAATLAGAHAFIADLAEGYGTDMGEAGQRLSGGQRRLVALAGVLLGDPPILLLDEPGSDLDANAAEALRQTLRGLAERQTIVVATHNPALVRICDGVAVLEKGRLVLGGRPDDLLEHLGMVRKA